MADSLLEVKDLEVHFATRQGVVSRCVASPSGLTHMRLSVLLVNPVVVRA